MKITVRILATFVCLLLSLISDNAYGDVINVTTPKQASTLPEKYDLEFDGIFYRITSVDTLSVEVVGGENVYTGEIVIPDYVNYRGRQFRVTSIADRCFYNSPITGITIGKNITTIGIMPFWDCTKLTSVSFSDGTNRLIFKDYDPKSRYNDPQSGRSYSTGFINCPIQRLYLGRDIVTGIDYQTFGKPFNNLENATEIMIGPTVTRLEISLPGAQKIKALKIPSSVTYIGHGIFREWNGLKSICFEDGENELYCNEDFSYLPLEYVYIGRDIEVRDNSFSESSISKIDIGGQVTSLMPITYLAELTEIRIPKNVRKIESFIGCNNLRSIYCLTETPPTSLYFSSDYATGVFDDVVFAMGTLYVPQGCAEVYKKTEGWDKFFEIKEYDGSTAAPSIIPDDNLNIIEIFDINGCKVQQMQRGLNIVKYSDGTVKKILQ